MRTLAILLLCVGCVKAQTAEITFEQEPSQFLVHMVRESLDSLHEVAGCVTKYSQRAETLYIEKIVPARYVRSDSMRILSFVPLCDDAVPVIHSHLLQYALPNSPSTTDLNVAKERHAPWNLIVDVDKWHYYVFMY